MNCNIESSEILLAPSLICLDLCNLERDTHIVETLGADLLHVDIIDGHFSPSMPLGLDTVRQLRAITNLPFDVHLMTENNDFFISELIDIGVAQIVFHLEGERHIDRQLNRIREAGIRAGVALKPATSLHTLDYVLEKCDTVLLMLINPGYAGIHSERRVSYDTRKIHELHQLIELRGLHTAVEIDGRVSLDDITRFGGHSVNTFVVGSTCIDKNNLHDSFSCLLKTVKGAQNV